MTDVPVVTEGDFAEQRISSKWPTQSFMRLWRNHGGEQHGPRVETVTMPMDRLAGFINDIAAAARPTDPEVVVKLAAAEARAAVLEAEMAQARRLVLEEAAAAVECHDRTDRGWIKGSLWDALTREAVARIRALADPKTQGGRDAER